MKKTIIFILVLFSILQAFAQAPNSFTYQGIVTRNNDTPLANKGISFRISILAVSENGTTDYSEKHTIVTTNNGVFTLNIGLGSAPTSTFANINWNANAKYLKVEMDTTNTGSYQTIGTPTLLQSVPFALQAANAVNATNATNSTNAVNATNATNATTATNALKIQGVSISNTAPKPGDLLMYNGTAWIPTAPTPSVSALYKGNYPDMTIGVVGSTTIYKTKINDTHSAYSNGIYTVPISGTYDISAQAQVSSVNSPGWSAGQIVQISILIDGAEKYVSIISAAASITHLFPNINVKAIPLTANQKVSIYMVHTNSTGANFGGDPNTNFFSISRSGN